MGNMNLNAYTGKDLQNFLSMLNQFESEGVTDIRFVRQRLQNHIDGEFRNRRAMRNAAGRTMTKQQPGPICPSCGKGHLTPWPNNEGLHILGCSICRYSEAIQ